MSQMPEFVLQLEQASGLPWWCLLLLAALVLVILILGVSLSREKRRNRVGAVNIPRGATTESAQADEAPAQDDAEPEPDTEEPADSDGNDSEATPAPEGALEEEPTAEERDREEVSSEAPPAEPVVETDDLEETDESPAEEVAVQAEVPAIASPEVEVLEDNLAEGSESLELNDDEIIKATGGNHSRVGQSAFGIDFGFLEEYEAEYEHALEEFRRLRGKNDGAAE